ncbi:hypothetical protein [Sphingobacterium sp. CZ-2]|uniref:hypothetical protein n=1 Tax=Sphingobacterium sp. CZ-2 TaxID=2557994 RepID=UPI00106F75F1|nr:hypothetical protein [Sphingobacterium sp. CZ-2]QBR12245.1 hypothetical protein E3D81_08750 [Sphingobacterium sp. CZ-2]
MNLKKSVLSIVILLFLSLSLSSILYILFLFGSSGNWPVWAMIIFPAVVALFVIFMARQRIGKGLIIIGVMLPILVSLLFQPLVKSLRYNFGEVRTLKTIYDLKPYDKALFLDAEDWYVDRMQVIPVSREVPLSGLFNFGKKKIEALFLVPIFQKDEPYMAYARGWMAFDYSKMFAADEVNEESINKFLESSLSHFKRLNLRQFSYLERMPRNNAQDLFSKMSQTHEFYKSGFGNIYQGQDVDRDYLSAYYLKFFLFSLLIIGIPGILIILAALYLVERYWKNLSV